MKLMKLTPKEAKAAKKRRVAYEHDLAIEGLKLHPDDKKMMDKIERDQMGYKEGINTMVDHLKEQGVIPLTPETEAADRSR